MKIPLGGSTAIAAIAAIVLAAPSLFAQLPPGTGMLNESGQAVVLRGGWLFDGKSEGRLPNPGILVRAGKFIAVGGLEDAEVPGDAYEVELESDQTILPGMFDLHAHYRMDLAGSGPVDEVDYVPALRLATGVTSTWPAGATQPERLLAARRRIDRGEQVGARIFGSGPYLGAARCEDARTHRDECDAWPNSITAAEIRRQIDHWAEQGITSVKVKLVSPEEFRVIADRAHRHGLTVSGHIYNYDGRRSDVGHREAILMGIDRIEHTFVPPTVLFAGEAEPGTPAFEEWARLYLDHGVYFDGTSWLFGQRTLKAMDPDAQWIEEEQFYTPYVREWRAERRRRAEKAGRNPDAPSEQAAPYPEIFAYESRAIRAFYEMGGGHLLTTGTDTGFRGLEFPGELLALQSMGLPPAAVLKAATINGANALGVGSLLGTVEPGKLADLFIVDGNPLVDVRAARNGRWVMVRGELYDIDALFDAVRGKIGPRSADEVDTWQRNR